MCFFSEGEETLKSKMLAFEEVRKRLEEHHAQQLSLLIAEQEREQARLRKVRCYSTGLEGGERGVVTCGILVISPPACLNLKESLILILGY